MFGWEPPRSGLVLWFRKDNMCDKPTRLRKAILGLTAIEKSAPKITPEDIKSRWSLLADSGGTPFSIAEEANSETINDERFEVLISKLNSYL